MVLESILNPKNAENKPLHVFIISFIISIIAVLFANQLFPGQASILSVLLITMIFVPFFQRLFVIEEEKEDEYIESAVKRRMEGHLFQRHKQVIITFSAFFLGVVIALSFVYVFMPEYSNVFVLQAETLTQISSHSSGDFLGTISEDVFPVEFGVFSGTVIGEGNFWRFFINNTQVMVLMFVLSVLFGAGAVFILTWNASVIALYLGLVVKSFMVQGLHSTTAYLYGVPVGLGMIALHGIPEIAAYFMAGLGGGILSVGFVREKLKSPEFMNILKDSLIFLVAAEVLILIAAGIEAVI